LRLKVGDYEIPEGALLFVKITIGPYPVSFGGAISMDEAPALMRRLKLLSQERAIHYDVVDKEGVSSDGICNLIHLKFARTPTQPPLIRFYAQLAHPFIT